MTELVGFDINRIRIWLWNLNWNAKDFRGNTLLNSWANIGMPPR